MQDLGGLSGDPVENRAVDARHGQNARAAASVELLHERQATVNDVFGHPWVLTQMLVDTSPEEWGGETVTPRGRP